MHRRRLLALLRSGLVLSAAASVIPSSLQARGPTGARGRAALLVPLTGPSAPVGLSMSRAAALGDSAVKEEAMLVLDTGGTPAGAAAAAQTAIKRGARIILGPLFSAETRAVLAAVAGRVPVLSFSNDAGLIESGAFLLGITAPQSISAILHYARTRGVRRVAILGGGSGWALQASAAAQKLQGALGIDIVLLPAGDRIDLAAMRRACGGELPDALLVADGGTIFLDAARALGGSGVQLLGTPQVTVDAPAALAAANGAWIAGPDPGALAEFATRYEARNGGAPGSIAALAYDGAAIIRTLRAAGSFDRSALLGASGFAAATGPLRFRADGSATRELAILVIGPDGLSMVGKSDTA